MARVQADHAAFTDDGRWRDVSSATNSWSRRSGAVALDYLPPACQAPARRRPHLGEFTPRCTGVVRATAWSRVTCSRARRLREHARIDQPDPEAAVRAAFVIGVLHTRAEDGLRSWIRDPCRGGGGVPRRPDRDGPPVSVLFLIHARRPSFFMRARTRGRVVPGSRRAGRWWRGAGSGRSRRRPSRRTRFDERPRRPRRTSTRPPSAPGSANQRGTSRAPPRTRTGPVRVRLEVLLADVDRERVLELDVPDPVGVPADDADRVDARPTVSSPVSTASPTSVRVGAVEQPFEASPRRSADRKSTCSAVRTPCSSGRAADRVPAGGQPVDARRRPARRRRPAAGRRGRRGRSRPARRARRRTSAARSDDGGDVVADQRRQRPGEVLHRPLLRIPEPAGHGRDRALVEERSEPGDGAEVGGELLGVAQRLPSAGARGQLDALEAGDRHGLERALVLLAADEVVELGLPLVDRVAPT